MLSFLSPPPTALNIAKLKAGFGKDGTCYLKPPTFPCVEHLVCGCGVIKIENIIDFIGKDLLKCVSVNDPKLFEQWLLGLRMNTKLPLSPYLVSLLYAFDMPEASVLFIVDKDTYVLSEIGMEWIKPKGLCKTVKTIQACDNAVFLRIGHKDVLPAFVLTDEKTEPSFQKFYGALPVSNFVLSYIKRISSGGRWVNVSSLQDIIRKSKDEYHFHQQLYKIIECVCPSYPRYQLISFLTFTHKHGRNLIPVITNDKPPVLHWIDAVGCTVHHTIFRKEKLIQASILATIKVLSGTLRLEK